MNEIRQHPTCLCTTPNLLANTPIETFLAGNSDTFGNYLLTEILKTGRTEQAGQIGRTGQTRSILKLNMPGHLCNFCDDIVMEKKKKGPEPELPM